ncbi:ABC transporter permease [Novosphingobium sp. FSY-8]|uniref:Transport permease protein n=1 Tax=Novosphingobium ovatum TaxID=1908523 RepID=A0ABW9XAF6_9SPHN|nr:ABC transporter permease [Novosphingobium ovatum]NBC35511.1 ABC transporter permease [Novosphingobium ovatum]
MADQPRFTTGPLPDDALSADSASGAAVLRHFPAHGEPTIHGVNWLGLWTLYSKEVRRFMKVQTQTVWAPAITTLLFLVIFSLAMGRGDRLVLGVNFATFIAPGLIAMGMMNNAFQNASFSFLSGKMMGTIIDFLMPPLSTAELMVGMVAGAITRGVMVALALGGAMLLWPGVSLAMAHPWAVVWFGLNGALLLALIGLLSSIWAEKFDHNAAITNFVIQPLSLLSGTFYVIDNLHPAFQAISRVNPFFYIISGFRFGFLGQSDIGATNMAVLHGALGIGLLNAAVAVVTYYVLRSGWKLKG